LQRLEEQLVVIVPSWSRAPAIEAYQAMRGASFLVAVTVAAEIGDLRRLDSFGGNWWRFSARSHASGRPATLCAAPASPWLASNRRTRRVLVDAAWSYRHPRVSQTPRTRLEGLPKSVRYTAWKAQIRLCGRYHRLSAAGKKLPVVIAAVAREMAAFLWAIGRQVVPAA
jgi:transposase